MKKYTVTTRQLLRNLCINSNWFTCGSNEQYNKLFYANENGCTIEEIATIIWVCSDECCRMDILDDLKSARVDFWKQMFDIKDENQIYLVYDVFGIIHNAPFIDIVDMISDPEIVDFNYEHIASIYNLNQEMIWKRDNE